MEIVKRPQFLFTYYNPFDSHKNNLGNAFLDYAKDVNLANYSSQVVGKFIEQQTEEQLKAIDNLSSEVAMIGDDIRYGFNKINQRLTLIQVEQFNTNLLLKDIKHILKQPDSEKQRMKHIELGVKFFNQALKNEDLIIDAVEEFDKAFALMRQDWFTSYQLGLCHTYYKPLQDLSKAETYFLNAAKYASVDTLVINDFNEAFYQSIAITKNENNNLLDFASECYLQAALIKYIQSDFVGSVTHAKKATLTSSNNAKAFFLLAKYESRLGENQSAIESLKTANNLDNNIYKVFPDDIDILKNSLFSSFYSETKFNNLQKEEQKEKELLCYFLWIILENQIRDRLWNYYTNIGLGRERWLDYSYTMRKILEGQKIQISKSFRKKKTDTINTLISIFHNDKKVLNFVRNAKAELDKYYRENYEKNQKDEDDFRLRYLKSNRYDVGERKVPLSLDDAIKRNYSGLDSKIDDLYRKSILNLNLFDIYTEELKKHNLLDKIKMLGDTPQQKNICQLHFDCFLTGKSLSTLPSPQELEREKSWWEKLFG